MATAPANISKVEKKLMVNTFKHFNLIKRISKPHNFLDIINFCNAFDAVLII